MPVETMPSGLQFEFREMKTFDEDKIAEARESKNPKDRDVVMDQILRDCWVRTLDHGPYLNRLKDGRVDFMDLLAGDISFYMWRLYRESRGDEMPVTVPCPQGHREMTPLNLAELEVYRLSERSQQMFANDEPFEFTLPRCGRSVTWGLMTFRMQKALQETMAANRKHQVSELMAARVRSIAGFDEQGMDPETNEDKLAFISNMSSFDKQALQDEILSVECGVESLVDLRCPTFGCGQIVSVDLEEKGGIDFFAQRRHKRRSSRK